MLSPAVVILYRNRVAPLDKKAVLPSAGLAIMAFSIGVGTIMSGAKAI